MTMMTKPKSEVVIPKSFQELRDFSVEVINDMSLHLQSKYEISDIDTEFFALQMVSLLKGFAYEYHRFMLAGKVPHKDQFKRTRPKK